MLCTVASSHSARQRSDVREAQEARACSESGITLPHSIHENAVRVAALVVTTAASQLSTDLQVLTVLSCTTENSCLFRPVTGLTQAGFSPPVSLDTGSCFASTQTSQTTDVSAVVSVSVACVRLVLHLCLLVFAPVS